MSFLKYNREKYLCGRFVYLAKSLFISYFLFVLIMFFLQRDLLYLPHDGQEAPEEYNVPMSEVEFSAADGVKLVSWYKKPQEGKPTILYFHGNAGHLGYRASKYRTYFEGGYGLLALGYRGYGKSEGLPSEDGFYQDARAALKWLSEQGVTSSDIILYGESLGTGIAMQMATEYDLCAVILEAPYESMMKVGARIYPLLPVYYVLRDRFDSISKVDNIQEPVLIFHGKKDGLILVEHGENLLKSLVQSGNVESEIVIFPEAGHDNINAAKVIKYIDKFITKINQ